MVASHHTRSDDQIWYTDSGALNHITSDLANLSIHNAYHGKDHVVVFNASGLNISHIGSSQLHHNSSPFKMNNILHCPSVSANLLYVNQFSRDNDCYFLFDSDGFCVKDKLTGKMLFCGMSDHGLYPINLCAL